MKLLQSSWSNLVLFDHIYRQLKHSPSSHAPRIVLITGESNLLLARFQRLLHLRLFPVNNLSNTITESFDSLIEKNAT